MCSSLLHNDAPLPSSTPQRQEERLKWLKDCKQYILVCLEQLSERHTDWNEDCHVCLPARLYIRQDAIFHFLLPCCLSAAPLCQLYTQETPLQQFFHHSLLHATLFFPQDMNLLTCHTKRIHILLLLKVLKDINVLVHQSSQRRVHRCAFMCMCDKRASS